jgi:hypothetical protein
MYKPLLAEREETARVKEIIKQIEKEDNIHSLLLTERTEKRQLMDKQRYVERERILMKERELTKDMEKEILQIKKEHEHHFAQLSEWRFPVG